MIFGMPNAIYKANVTWAGAPESEPVSIEGSAHVLIVPASFTAGSMTVQVEVDGAWTNVVYDNADWSQTIQPGRANVLRHEIFGTFGSRVRFVFPGAENGICQLTSLQVA